MSVTLGEQVMLLSLDDESGAAKERAAASWAVAGGIVLELVLAGKLSVHKDRMSVADRTPTGTALLDERLALIDAWAAGRKKPPTVTEWLMRDREKSVKATIASLCDRGLVGEERTRLLGLFPVTRYPEADGSVERELRERLRALVLDGAEPGERDAGLVALIHGAKLHRIAFPGVPRKQVAARIQEIADGEWASRAVGDAIRAMQAVLAAATAAAVAAAAV
ncbi:GPP34 family phosphoprotein [Streptomyces sp. NPDC060194]|uniref:GOLPH3/VPS74 family protein n=1 Tax=Streptomyces sp. NPDC060194 TaxID=3347069 RepID=UPI0036643EF5